MRSAVTNPTPVDEYLQEELENNRIAKVQPPVSPRVVINRFGLIPKQGQPNKWRLILDLSYSPNQSVNDGINRELASLHYASVDTAVKQVIKLGQGALMAKVDIRHAYRNMPVHPDDCPLLGMQWRGRVFIDKALPFGLH